MTTRYSLLIILAAFALCSTAAYSQLAKPTLAAENVNWGWFDLAMTENSITPTGTHWQITNEDGSFVLFDSWRDPKACDNDVFEGRITSDYVADTRDLTSKKIIGCADNRVYKAKVRYTDGTQWSPFSDPITITTPPEPVRNDDTVYVLLYGHSLMAWNGLCGMSMGDGLLLSETDGYQTPNYGNSFGHALQTELRRTTGKTVTLINYAVNGSRQSRWMRSGKGSDTALDNSPYDMYENYIRFYRPGGQPEDGKFLDTSKYKIAAFFFAHNDARAPYPVGNYVEDATSIINELTGKGVKVVYNSIHYATAMQTEDPYHWAGAQYDQQLRYFNAWDSMMTAMVPTNNRLWRGLDFYNLFKSDTERYWFPDNIHVNLSEGVPGIVVPLAKIIRNAIENSTASAATGATRLDESSLTVSPNPSSSSLTFRIANAQSGHVTVEIVDILGRNVQTIFDDTMERGEQRLKLDAGTLQPGTYLCRLRTGSGVTARKFQVVQ
jgi:hypothetical protein